MNFTMKIFVFYLLLGNAGRRLAVGVPVQEKSISTKKDAGNGEKSTQDQKGQNLFSSMEEVLSDSSLDNANRNRKWTRGIVPYEISTLYTSNERAVVMGAIREYQSKTCLKFVARKREADYIHITPDDGKGSSVSPYCYSYVGKMGGKQFVKMYNECVRPSAMIHELGHVIGFEHEHNRVDRDDQITIHWDNIDSTFHYAYQKVSRQDYDTLGLAYDYKSIMHYPDASFAKAGKKAFTLKRAGDLSRENQRLSPLDVSKIKKYYQC